MGWRPWGNQLSKEDFQDFASSLSSMCQKYDRIVADNFSLRVVHFTGEEYEGVPAFTDGQIIGINADGISEVAAFLGWTKQLFVLAYKGFNNHELAHLLYTPSVYMDKNAQECKDTQGPRRSYWNVLEDARIERLLIAEYPLKKMYLQAAVAYVIAAYTDTTLKNNQKDYAQHMWPTLAGRTYLPQADRDAMREEWINLPNRPIHVYKGNGVEPEEAAGLIEQTIEAYKQLVLPAQHKEAIVLVQQFADLLGAMDGQNGDVAVVGVASDSGKSEGRQERAQGKADSNDSDDNDEGDSDGDSEQTSISKTVTGPPRSQVKLKQLTNTLQDMLDSADEDVAKDISKTVEQANDGVAEARLNEQHKSSRHMPVTTEMRREAGAVARIIGKLQDSLVEGRVSHQHSGRLNVTHAMASRGSSTDVFDISLPAIEEFASVEGVIVYDGSGSMAECIREVVGGLWVLKYGFDQRNVKTTVIHYSDPGQEAVIYRAQDKASLKRVDYEFADSSTYVEPALRLANHALARSHARHKYLVILTDGMWDDPSESEAWIEKMKQQGVVTAVIYYSDMQRHYIGGKYTTPSKDQLQKMHQHKCDYFVHTQDHRSLVKFVETMVARFLRERR